MCEPASSTLIESYDNYDYDTCLAKCKDTSKCQVMSHDGGTGCYLYESCAATKFASSCSSRIDSIPLIPVPTSGVDPACYNVD